MDEPREDRSAPVWPARVVWFHEADQGQLPCSPSAWRSAGLEPVALALPTGAEERLLLAQALAGSCGAFVLPGDDDDARALAGGIEENTGKPVFLAPLAGRVRAAAEALLHLAPAEEGSAPAIGLVGAEAEAVARLLLDGEEGTEEEGRGTPRVSAAQLRRARPAPGALPGVGPDPATLQGPLGLLISSGAAGQAPEPPEALSEVAQVFTRDAVGDGLALPALLRATVDLGRTPDEADQARVARRLARLGQGALPGLEDARLLGALATACAGDAAPADYARALAERRSLLRVALAAPLARARQAPPALVFVDGEDPRAICAAAALAEDGVCIPWLLGDSFRVEARAKAEGVSLDKVRAVDPKRDKRRAAFADALTRALGTRTGLTPARAGELVTTPLLFAGVALLLGEAQAIVLPEGEGLEPLGTLAQLLPPQAPWRVHVGAHLLAVPGGQVLAVADTAGRSDPTAEELADAAHGAARLLGDLLGAPPRVALLSHADLAPGDDPTARRVELACQVLRAREPGLAVAGPLRAATALDAEALRGRHPGAALDGPAQVLVLGDRAGALALVGALQRLGGVEAQGPFLCSVDWAVGISPPGADATGLELLGALLSARAVARPVSPVERPAALEELRTGRLTGNLGAPTGRITPGPQARPTGSGNATPRPAASRPTDEEARTPAAAPRPAPEPAGKGATGRAPAVAAPRPSVSAPEPARPGAARGLGATPSSIASDPRPRPGRATRTGPGPGKGED